MRILLAVPLASLVLAACATSPPKDEAARAPSAGAGATKDGFCVVIEPDVSEIEYRDGDTVLRGRLAVPFGASLVPADKARLPAVLVVHEWWGRTPHSDHSAEELAKLGYVGFAVDMYGEGRTTKDPEEAGKWAGAIKKDPETMRRRLRAALDLVRGLPHVDGSRVACIGYCFGGTMSLEAAWAGLDLRGVVSFHGSLTTPQDPAAVKAPVLVLHGADDDLVSAESMAAFVKSMRDNRLDWELVSYGGAVHSFTNPAADGSFNALVKYHPQAAARSWEAMRDFLAERFAGAVVK